MPGVNIAAQVSVPPDPALVVAPLPMPLIDTVPAEPLVPPKATPPPVEPPAPPFAPAAPLAPPLPMGLMPWSPPVVGLHARAASTATSGSINPKALRKGNIGGL